jgi:GntR family transcriptional regulator / MocR family aminotransferase
VVWELSRLRHPLAEAPHRDGVVNFGAPAEHAFGPAIDALRRVLSASGLGA